MGQSIDCQTTVLKDNSKLYWQFNCDRIWLMLENTAGEKITIDEADPDLHVYTYRLGFHLIREFNGSLLFRSGCGASGPCSYVLIDKFTGKTTHEYGQLICIDTDSQYNEESHPYEYDFIVYLSEDSNHLIVEYIESMQIVKVPFEDASTTAIIPEQQFDKMILNDRTLTLFYRTDDNQNKAIKINL